MAKRNNDHLSLSEVLKAFVETNKLDKGIDKIQVQNCLLYTSPSPRD